MIKRFLLLFMIFNLIGCEYFSQLRSDATLNKVIENKITKNPAHIDLSNLENFKYDKLLILEPYTDINKIATELKVDLSNISENTIHSSDDFNLLIFLKNNKSIKIVELSRKNGDFKDYKIVIDCKSAIFERDDNGIIVLKNNTNQE